MNHARIAQAFHKRPFCEGALAERIRDGKVSNKTHATCAIGALILDTKAVRKFDGNDLVTPEDEQDFQDDHEEFSIPKPTLKKRRVTAVDLEDADTDEMVDEFWPELRDTYGFEDPADVHEFMYMNDAAVAGAVAGEGKLELKAPDEMQTEDKAYADRTIRTRVKKRVLWYLHELAKKAGHGT
jgi:hypothetical protein